MQYNFIGAALVLNADFHITPTEVERRIQPHAHAPFSDEVITGVVRMPQIVVSPPYLA